LELGILNEKFEVRNSKFLASNLYPAFAIFTIIFLISLESCASLSPVISGSPVSAPFIESIIPEWQPWLAEQVFAEDLQPGLSYFAGKIKNPKLCFYALRIDLSQEGLKIVTGSGLAADGEIRSTFVSSFVRRNGLFAGINASPFDPVSGKEGETRSIVGIAISDGVLISPPDSRYDALVFYSAEGDPAEVQHKITGAENFSENNQESPRAEIINQGEIKNRENIICAVGGFHQILKTGDLTERTAQITARHPRSAAGLSAGARYLYLLVIDGRRPLSIGATEAETALLLQKLGSFDGLNFDGGGSTAMALRYPDGKTRIVNTPVHGGILHKERGVANCLAVGTAGIVPIPAVGTAGIGTTADVGAY
jgi:exopolysaccharide biosynthesis protein